MPTIRHRLTAAAGLTGLLVTPGWASVRDSSGCSFELLNEGISSFSTSASSTNFELTASSSSYTNQLRNSSSLAMRNGYVGTIYEVDSLQVVPSGPNVDEGTTVSFTAVATLDDGTTLTLPASRVAWETPAAPLGPIDSTTGEISKGPVALEFDSLPRGGSSAGGGLFDTAWSSLELQASEEGEEEELAILNGRDQSTAKTFLARLREGLGR